jgi:hypothetical protein
MSYHLKPFLIRVYVSVFSLAESVVVVENGGVRVLRGAIRPSLLADLRELIGAFGIRNAWILAHKTPAGYRLSFFGIPPESQQRFRNIWAAHCR